MIKSNAGKYFEKILYEGTTKFTDKPVSSVHLLHKSLNKENPL
jgi:hypothetical protein